MSNLNSNDTLEARVSYPGTALRLSAYGYSGVRGAVALVAALYVCSRPCYNSIPCKESSIGVSSTAPLR